MEEGDSLFAENLDVFRVRHTVQAELELVEFSMYGRCPQYLAIDGNVQLRRSVFKSLSLLAAQMHPRLFVVAGIARWILVIGLAIVEREVHINTRNSKDLVCGIEAGLAGN